MIGTRYFLALGLTLIASLTACTSTGTGSGELSRRGLADEPVQFSWQSDDGGISGSMRATLQDATYVGRFFQITQQTQTDTLAPMWDGWDEGWDDWPDEDSLDASQFTTRYSGKVVANLRRADGQRMRCRFRMAEPANGMQGGGAGKCQLQGGGTIDAQF